MDNSYLSSSFSYDSSVDYSSPSIPTYLQSPSFTPCPVHSPYLFYPSPTQLMNTTLSYSYYPPQQQSHTFSPLVQQHPFISTSVDRTPLRRHQCFMKYELQILHQMYIQDSYPSVDVLQQLAVQLKVSIEKVRQWFKNRRHSDKQKQRTTTA